MKIQYKGYGWVSILIVISSVPATTQTITTFEQRRQEYLANSAEYARCGHDIWAYLERNDQGQYARIRQVINGWINSPIEPGCWEGGYGANELYLTRVLRQYVAQLSLDDRSKIEKHLDAMVVSKYFSQGTSNGALMDHAARYLWAERHSSATVQYGTVCEQCQDLTFTWQGKTYKLGDTYNALELSRAWINYIFDRWLTTDDPTGELDGDYTRTFIFSLLTLYDFAQDPLMRVKAKMILDFLLIESIMDTSVQLWGGAVGRSYGWTTLSGGPGIFWYPYWGFGNDAPSDNVLAYISSYRLPALIADLGLHQDEADSYWHLNMENHTYGATAEKRTFVSKHYNLGGSIIMWLGHMGSPTGGDRIRFWINDQSTIQHPSGGEYYLTDHLGKAGFQYRNAMYVEIENPVLFVVNSNAFDQGAVQLEEIDDSVVGKYWRLRAGRGWYFFKEGKAMLGIQFNSSGAGLEFGIEGVDGSFSEFQNRLRSQAGLVIGGFKTSKGNLISSRYNGRYSITTVNAKDAYQLPFDRIEAIDNNGNKIVDWNNRVMTVSRHGRRTIYNFNNWSFSEDGAGPGGDFQPPSPPTNVKISPGN